MKTFINLFKEYSIPKDGFWYPSAFTIIQAELILRLSDEEINSI